MRDFHLPGRSAVFATNGMCATSHPLAASVAIDILKRGGNAMDAAIAGAVLLGICEPQMTGIGGDCFALWSPANSNEVFALNGSGRAPAGADPEQLRAMGHESMPIDGANSVTIPTAIDAFCHLNAKHGRLGLDAVLDPAIHYAENGVPVAPRVAFDWTANAARLRGAAKTHYLLQGNAPTTGQIFRAPGQAQVLRKIAKHGRNAFYSGEVAADIVDTLRDAGGVHSTQDLDSARCEMTTPISGTYRDIELVEHPPNGQGATAILLLNILSHFDLSGLDPFGSARAHIEAEASKLAFGARNRVIADPDHCVGLDWMLDTATSKEMAQQISLTNVGNHPAPPVGAPHRDTVYITVVDQDQMSVSLIYSIFNSFGSGIASDKFGILLQNRGAGFSLQNDHPNLYGPGKRPLHTIIPGMLRADGRVSMSFGVMGGQYQPCGHARFISNLRDFGLSAQAAIDAPRCFADLGTLKVERGYATPVVQELADLGHDVVVPDAPLGGAQSICIRDDGVLEGSSDPRKDGIALGY